MKKIKDLYHVLIGSDLGLPWKPQDAGTENDGIIDFHILFVADCVGELVNVPTLKQRRRHRGR